MQAFDLNSPDPESPETLDQIEKRYIRHILHEHNGNKTVTARILGIDRRTLYRKLHQIEEESQ